MWMMGFAGAWLAFFVGKLRGLNVRGKSVSSIQLHRANTVCKTAFISGTGCPAEYLVQHENGMWIANPQPCGSGLQIPNSEVSLPFNFIKPIPFAKRLSFVAPDALRNIRCNGQKQCLTA